MCVMFFSTFCVSPTPQKTHMYLPYIKCHMYIPCIKCHMYIPCIKCHMYIPCIKCHMHIPYLKCHMYIPCIKCHMYIPYRKCHMYIPYIKCHLISRVEGGGRKCGLAVGALFFCGRGCLPLLQLPHLVSGGRLSPFCVFAEIVRCLLLRAMVRLDVMMILLLCGLLATEGDDDSAAGAAVRDDEHAGCPLPLEYPAESRCSCRVCSVLTWRCRVCSVLTWRSIGNDLPHARCYSSSSSFTSLLTDRTAAAAPWSCCRAYWTPFGGAKRRPKLISQLATVSLHSRKSVATIFICRAGNDEEGAATTAARNVFRP